MSAKADLELNLIEIVKAQAASSPKVSVASSDDSDVIVVSQVSSSSSAGADIEDVIIEEDIVIDETQTSVVPESPSVEVKPDAVSTPPRPVHNTVHPPIEVEDEDEDDVDELLEEVEELSVKTPISSPVKKFDSPIPHSIVSNESKPEILDEFDDDDENDW